MTAHDPEGERRLVTVLFADLVGYTSASEARDPELMQETLDLCFGRLGDEIRRYGGFVDKVIGDAIMALFGAPRAQEDDAGKAIAAGLAMQRALEELVPEVEARLGDRFYLRIGINTGLVVTGSVGPGGYTVTGDAVNVASRLESNAPHGSVLVGETTRRLARRQFEWGERQEIQVKNRTEPVVCYVAKGAPAGVMRLVPSPSESTFVGRADALEQLLSAWKACERACAVDLVGEAGIGKTRFLAHFLATENVSAEQVLYTRADTPPRTFGPLLQLLPAIAPGMSSQLARQVEQLGRAHEDAEAPAFSSDWLVDGIAAVLTDLARGQKVMLVLDDVHRADGATLDVVEKLLPRIAELPVVVALLRQPSGRRPQRTPTATTTIMLEPLGGGDAAALVRSLAGGITEERVQTVVRQAGGNPLYLEVLAAAAALAPAGMHVPETLQTAIVARIDDLPPAPRQLIREASIFGQSFLEEPLKRTTTLDDGCYDALIALCDAGLLDAVSFGDARGYNFRHSLVQQVLYDGLLRRRRQHLHLRAAEALELSRDEGMDIEPEQVAHHFERGGDNQRAAQYHLASAERAERLHAASEARRHRRVASRLLSMTSIADLYGGPRAPSVAARAAAVGVQLFMAAALVLPAFLLLALQRPRDDATTLGLPLDIVEFNASSVLLAIALGGIPLFIAGVLFTHLAAPTLMRRRVHAQDIAVALIMAWALALFAVALGYASLIGLLRFGLLDRLSTIYVGAATLQLLLGDRSLIVIAVAGTLAVAVIWTLLLRLQGAARTVQHARSPRQIDESRRWSAVRQLGALLLAAGVISLAALAAYQFDLLPNSESQPSLGGMAAGGFFTGFVVIGLAGVAALVIAGRGMPPESSFLRSGLCGFEVPLLTALAFGVLVWFGMRQAVVVSANEVDVPGDIEQFDRAVALFPDLGLAYYLRGERHLAEASKAVDGEAEFRLAREDFDDAARLDPSFPATYLARGFTLAELGEYDAAIADANRLIELRPTHPGGYAIRALANARLGDLAAAGDDLAVALRPLPEDARGWDAYFIRCIALLAAQRFDEAQQECLRVLEINPGQIVALDTLVLIHGERGEYEQALEYVERMIDLDDENAATWYNRGSINQRLGNFERAEEDLSRSLELRPDDPVVLGERAVTRLHLDRVDDALADADAAVRVSPQQAYTRLYVARYAGRHDLAVSDANALIDDARSGSPNLPYLLSARGLALVQDGDIQRGMADLDEALRLDPEDAALYDRRGYARFVVGDLDAASLDFDEALRRLASLFPQSRAELHYHRALLLDAQGRPAQALAEIEEAAKVVEIPGVRRDIEEVRSRLRTTAGAQ